MNRLIGTKKIFYRNVGRANGLFLSSFNRIVDDRRIVINTLESLLDNGRISTKKIKLALSEIEASRIKLNLKRIPKNKADIKQIRDDLALKFTEESQFALDQGIVSLAINFEEFIRRTLIKFYTDDPRRLSKDKELKLGEIIDKTSLIDIYEDLATKAAKDILYGSTIRWFEIINKSLKFSFEGNMRAQKATTELFLVRNCIVHNAKFTTRELLSFDPKYIGIGKVNPTIKDYIRFRSSITKIVEDIYDQFNLKYANKYLFVHSAMSDIKQLHQEQTGNLRDTIDLRIKRGGLNALVKKYFLIELNELRQLLQSEVFECKLLATKILCLQYKSTHDAETKKKIFIFCILNLDLFNDTELIQFMTRNITTGSKVTAHNFQLLGALSKQYQPLKAYFLLRLIQKSPTIASKRHLIWLISNVERHAMRSAKNSKDIRLLRDSKTKAMQVVSLLPS